jgi:hypothetical protein
MKHDYKLPKSSAIDLISSIVKDAFDGWTPEQTRTLVTEHLITYRLLDKQGGWVENDLKKHADFLLPKDFGEGAILDFIDEMASNAQANPYLLSFLERASSSSFEELSDRVHKEGSKTFRSVVTHALVLDRITRLMADDLNFLQTVRHLWQKARESANIAKDLTWFEKAKIASVEKPIIIQYEKFRAGQEIPPDFMRWMLSLNIMEAVLLDRVNGRRDNAYAGWVLASHRPGAIKKDPRTDSGPSGWSTGRKAVSLFPPLPRLWADLYHSWNLAFCMQFKTFPWLMTKLLIPCVSGYQTQPETYLYYRILALFAYLNYTFLWRSDRLNNGIEGPNWEDKALLALWGKVNAESADNYLRALHQHTKQPLK